MAVTALSGLVDDSDILSNERVIDMADTIAMLDPDVSQFTTMLMKIASEEAYSSKVEWLEDQLFPRLSALAASATSADTNLTVTTGDGQLFRAGDVIRNQVTGEAYAVTNVSTDTVGVSRAIGSVAAASSASGAQLLIVSNAAAQGATLGTRKITKRVAAYNYTQIFRHPYGFTNTAAVSKMYGGGLLEKERKKKLVEHKRAIENTLFFGARALNTGGSTPIGYCGGAIEYISTNIKNPAGALTKQLLDTYMQALLQHGSTNKVFFVSPTIATQISGFLRDAWQPVSTEGRLWGAKVDAFLNAAYGFRIPVVVKRDWNDFSTASTQYGGYGFLIDMEYVKLRPLNERNTMLLRNRQANDADESTEEYLTELSLQFQVEQNHGIVRGVT